MSVYPILKARLRKKQNITFITDAKLSITIEAIEEFDEITRSVPSIASYPVYEDSPIFSTPPDWTGQIEEEQTHTYELLQFLGKSVHWSTWDYNELKNKSEYLGNGKEAT